MIWDNKFTFHDLFVKVFVILTSEWETPTKESKEKYSTCPYICWRPTEFLFPDNLWSHIRRCSTEYFDFLVVRNAGTKPKIDNLHVAFCVKHYVLKFYISMTNAFAMAILQSTDNLSVNSSCVIFIHSTIWFRLQEPMSRASSYILHNENHLVLSFYCFVQLCNMRMIKSFHEFNFPSNGFLTLDLFHLFFKVDFESYLFIWLFMHPDIDCSISTLSDLLPNDVII